jgi:poly(A) polymerase
MDEPETRAVTEALARAGCAVRFVGGCVRDTLLGRPITDIDIATDALPDKVVDAVRAAGLKAVPTGLAHGTITAVADGKSFEITTLRCDVETDGRHATVRFTDDWDADAARRDLTMNAISVETTGMVHDPFGGRADVIAGRVRFVGAAYDRIVEDLLRLLRYFRFYAHYGAAPPDEEALAACRTLAPKLQNLSAERVRAELMKLLQALDPRPSLRLMRDAGVFAHFLPEATNLEVIERLVEIEDQVGICVDPMRRLMALLDGDASVVSQVADRLQLSNVERDYLMTLTGEVVSPDLDPTARRHLIYRLGVTAFCELVLLQWAGAKDGPGWRELLDWANGWSPKKFPVTGGDVLARGVPSGPAVGAALRAVEVWWINGAFVADRNACLARLDTEVVGKC